MISTNEMRETIRVFSLVENVRRVGIGPFRALRPPSSSYWIPRFCEKKRNVFKNQKLVPSLLIGFPIFFRGGGGVTQNGHSKVELPQIMGVITPSLGNTG